jgi:hypothetical protein
MSFAEELDAVRAALAPPTVGVLREAELDRLRELIAKHPEAARQMLAEADPA